MAPGELTTTGFRKPVSGREAQPTKDTAKRHTTEMGNERLDDLEGPEDEAIFCGATKFTKVPSRAPYWFLQPEPCRRLAYDEASPLKTKLRVQLVSRRTVLFAPLGSDGPL